MKTIARRKNSLRLAAWLLASLAICTTASGHNLPASSYSLIYSFCSQSNCVDGSIPQSGLIADASGNVYGSTTVGGQYGDGTVFELVSGQNGTWTESVLYSFCAKAGCSDGNTPVGRLVLDSAGRIYGVTQSGGASSNAGVAYELTPNSGRTRWKFRLLHTFCTQGGDCTDGDMPYAGLSYSGQAKGLLYDGSSPLYGTTFVGGANLTNRGVVFQLKQSRSGKWKEKTIYSFCSQSNCLDGETPESQLLTEGKVLYGTTNYGGDSAVGGGTVFKLVESGTTWAETVLYSFCVSTGCPDGVVPQGDLIMDASKNLFGTTVEGGANNGGAVFELTKNGVESVLYSFCSQTNCSDGKAPYAGLVQGAAGNLYGTTRSGGAYSDGVVFEMGKSFQLLYSFCQKTSCADGQFSNAPLLLDSSGNLVGVTTEGAAHGNGAVFKITF